MPKKIASGSGLRKHKAVHKMLIKAKHTELSTENTNTLSNNELFVVVREALEEVN